LAARLGDREVRLGGHRGLQPLGVVDEQLAPAAALSIRPDRAAPPPALQLDHEADTDLDLTAVARREAPPPTERTTRFRRSTE
jgi:hypothetical protein